jgi:Uma2 family endonuclease
MATIKSPATIEDLERLGDTECRYDLIRGELIEMPPTGFEHGDIALAIGTELRLFAQRTGLGRAAGSEAGYVLSEDPPVLLAPDASFVLNERLPERSERRRFLRLAPDLAVEVVSPSDPARYVHQKVTEYLEAGVRLVWVIEPDRRTITIHEANLPSRTLTVDNILDGGDVLPAFSVAVADIFA